MHEAKPSRTALRVAMRRAAHQIHDARPLVFDDPFAIQILPPESRLEIQRTPAASRKPFSAALRAFMVCRARFAEDVLAEGTRSHNIRQVLILGAGLDTFALRNPYPELRVFEVDHPATQVWKRSLLRTANLPVPRALSFVPVDFETQSLRQQLLHAGFDFSLPTAAAWLGVVPYLTPEAFAATARVLGRLPAGSSVVFDYSQPREVLSPLEQLMLDSLSARVALAGEPFQLFFTPERLAEELSWHNLTVVEDLDSDALNTRYLARRTDGLHLRGKAGRLCHAEVFARETING
ncbi:MAG TPA: class I SAM-dependent methyltransferase [Candidatus Aquilonibacter sp.]|nr:class I SAM-dependent methyltransferase [Candidatus Aquilonibacter sp.]